MHYNAEKQRDFSCLEVLMSVHKILLTCSKSFKIQNQMTSPVAMKTIENSCHGHILYNHIRPTNAQFSFTNTVTGILLSFHSQQNPLQGCHFFVHTINVPGN